MQANEEVHMSCFRRPTLTAMLLAVCWNLPAEIITEANASIPLAGQKCRVTGGPFSSCELEFVDPGGEAFYRAQAVAEASYGFLSVQSITDPPYWTTASSYASFSDIITVFGSDQIGYLVPIWSDVSDLSVGSYFVSGPVPGNVLNLTASLSAGDPFDFVPEMSGSLRLLSIRVLDQNLDPLESPAPLDYLSRSGASYQVEGATQVPEPGFTLPVLVGCLVLVFRGWIAGAPMGNRSVSATAQRLPSI
ncbi:MAG: hypothetical protein IT158_21450 [Bryobacterales bacterium]|nr:hypothetical protein [Bryobacterales bacterium]